MSVSTNKPSPTLALAMIVKNEEKNLRRCLDSVVGLVDEMVIVDTGSTDSTKEIVAEYADRAKSEGLVSAGVKILDFEWCDDFSAARNFGLEHVNSDWVLQLDADEEYLTGADTLMVALKDKYLWGFRVRFHSIPEGGDIEDSVTSFAPVRLFRNRAETRFRSRVHEHLDIDNERLGMTELNFNHFGFFLSKQRSTRNIELLHQALRDDPEGGHMWAKLGGEYLYSHRPTEAEPALLRALEIAKGSRMDWAVCAARDYAMCLFDMGKPRDAMEAVLGFQRQYPFYTDLYYLEGEIARGVGDTRRALTAYEACLKRGDTPGVSSWGGTGSRRPRERIDQILHTGAT